MVFVFGDLYLKLLLISKEGIVEFDGENMKKGFGIVCDKYGLVRFFLIVCLDLFCLVLSVLRLWNEI